MLHRTEGIVLKTVPFGEADLIVTYLTNDYGIIRAFAKSPRKIRSRFGSSLEPFTHANIAFWGKEDAPLPRLTQADIIYPFDGLRSALKCFLKVSEMTELTLHFVPERERNGKVYSLFLDTLHTAETDCDAGLLLLYYKLRLLEIVGYLPRLSGCGRCGRGGEAFYLSDGTVLCEACADGDKSSLRLSPGMTSLYMSLRGWASVKLQRLKPSEDLISGLSKVLDEHIRYIMERNLRTKKF
jgi:DNA repair protein RecO (recombination protein O)